METFLSLLYISSLFLGLTCAQSTTLPAPGQPTQQATVEGFVILGSSYVSAQQVRAFHLTRTNRSCEVSIPCQIFLGTPDKVYFIDKVENNPTQINGHPAWASGAHPLSSNQNVSNSNRLKSRMGFGG